MPPGDGSPAARAVDGSFPAAHSPAASAAVEPVDAVLFVALGAAWGSSYLFIRIGVESLPPLSLVVGRVGLGFVVLLAAILATRTAMPREARVYRHLLVLGTINIAIPFCLISWAEQTVDSGLAGIVNATVPFFTLLLAGTFIHDERITRARLVGIAVGFTGILVISSRSLGGGSLSGLLALLGASLSYGAGNTYARRMLRGTAARVQAIGQVGSGLIVVTLLALVIDGGITLPSRPEATFAVAWLGIIGSGLAYLIFFRLLTTWGPTRTSLVAYLLPIVAVVLGALFLQETIDARYLLGGMLVLLGIVIVSRPAPPPIVGS